MTSEEEGREMIAATLELTEWNITMAAAILGIDRGTPYAKISRYRIARPSRSRPGGGD
jgi:transcriptional regulator of acetoin/glycerol metabolism